MEEVVLGGLGRLGRELALWPWVWGTTTLGFEFEGRDSAPRPWVLGVVALGDRYSASRRLLLGVSALIGCGVKIKRLTG